MLYYLVWFLYLVIVIVLPVFAAPLLSLKFVKNHNRDLSSLIIFPFSLIILVAITNVLWNKYLLNTVYYEWDHIFLPYTLFTHESPGLDSTASWIAKGWSLQGLNLLWFGITLLLYLLSALITLLFVKIKNKKDIKPNVKIISFSILILGVLSLLSFSLQLYQTSLEKFQANRAPEQSTPTTVSNESSGSVETANWKTYVDKEIIKNSGFYLKIPSGWVIKYRKTDKPSEDYKGNFRIEFDFSPPDWKVSPQSVNWMGWGIMHVDVYEAKRDINQWITDFLPKYKSGLIVGEAKIIGSRTAYLISAAPKAAFFEGWRPRYVILGKNYSYELGFNNNGEDDSSKIIEKDIYPGIYFN